MGVIRGLFFDLDGTLVDTLEANIAAYQKAVGVVGRKLKREQIIEVYGTRADMFLREFFPRITDEEIQAVRQEKGSIYPDFLHLVRPNIQLIDLIRTLRPLHITALVTMAQQRNAMAVLEAIGIDNLFDHIVTGDSVKQGKPHPESYLKALSMANLAADEVIAFEDSPSGLKAAKAANISVVTVQIPGLTK